MIKNSVFKIYSNISTHIENILFRNKKNISKDSSLIINGFKTVRLKKGIQINLDKNKHVEINPYLSKIRLNKCQIDSIIQQIFMNNSIADYLYYTTGFRYNVTHVTAYQTTHIPIEFQNKAFYANHWHKDGPYSKNTLKVILPLSNIDKNSGAMMICNNDYSNNFSFYTKEDITNSFISEFQSKKLENVFIFNPHQCLHKAGNPKNNHFRQQLVFQINPSDRWSANKLLTKTQLYREPKFPILNYKTLNTRQLNSIEL